MLIVDQSGGIVFIFLHIICQQLGCAPPIAHGSGNQIEAFWENTKKALELPQGKFKSFFM